MGKLKAISREEAIEDLIRIGCRQPKQNDSLHRFVRKISEALRVDFEWLMFEALGYSRAFAEKQGLIAPLKAEEVQDDPEGEFRDGEVAALNAETEARNVSK